MTLVINNCLSYVETARNTLNANELVSIVENFYKESSIIEAKDLIYEKIGDRPKNVPMRRKAENRIEMEIRDILTAFEHAEAQSLSLPQFVAYGHMALPPPSGFELVTAAISSIRDEISGVKKEMAGYNRLKEEFQLMRTEMQQMKSEVTVPTQQQNNSYANTLNRGIPGLPHPGGAIGKNSTFATGSRKPPGNGNLQPPYATMRRNSRGERTTTSDKRGNETGQRDNGNWQLVTTRRRKAIVGTKKDESNGLRIAPRFGELYVGGCHKDETEDRISNYCKTNINVTPIEVEKLTTRSVDYIAFRLKFYLDDRNKCLDPENWSTGTIVRKFFRPRSELRVNSNNNNVS